MVEALRAALYFRVSTEEQAERGTSLADQLDRTTSYCRAQNWDIAEVYSDEGFSGATTDRTALQAMLADAARGTFDVVVVTDPDRLSRDLVDGLVIERELSRADVSVVYIVQPSMGTLERQLRGVIAEEERRKIRDRTSRGQRAVARDGHWPGGSPPYGYRIVQDATTGRSSLEICDHEADVLRWIIAAFVDARVSTADIAAALNANGVLTASSSRWIANRATGRWSPKQVRFVLRSCRAVTGTWVYRTSGGTIDVPVPAILTVDRYRHLQHRLTETSTGKGSTTKRHSYLLGGRVTSACGVSMHGMTKPDGSNRVYLCKNRNYAKGPDRCDCKPVSANAIEELVWNTVKDALSTPTRLLALAGIADADRLADNSEDVGGVDRKIQSIERALGTQIANLLKKGVDESSITHAVTQLEGDLAKLREHRDRLIEWTAARKDRVSRAERIASLAESARTALATPTAQLKQQTIALLDVRVHVTSYVVCPTCEGRGFVARTSEVNLGRRHHTGDICSTCLRYRRLPLITIEGLIPDVDNVVAVRPSGIAAVPFTIEPPARTGT
jgi:DNA invertase Pin-like site-specific DNA recombinase